MMPTKPPSNKLSLALILCFALALRLGAFLIFPNYTTHEDPWIYAMVAEQILTGQFHISADSLWFQFRYTLNYPLALAFAIIGKNVWAMAIWPLFAALGEIWLIYYLGGLLFNPRVGLWAAFLLAGFPFHVEFATFFVPDIIFSLFLGAGMFLFFKARQELMQQPDNYEIKAPVLTILFKYYLWSGLFIFGAYAVKNVAVLIFMVIFAILLWDYWNTKRLRLYYLLSPVTAVSCILALFTFYYFKTGDFLLDLHITQTFCQNISPHYIFTYLTQMFPLVFSNYVFHEFFGLFFYVAAILGVISIIKWEKPVMPLLIWILPLYLYMEFGSMAIDCYRPLYKDPRYLSFIITPTALLIAYYIEKWHTFESAKPRQIKTVIGAALAAALFLTSLYCIHSYFKASQELTNRHIYEKQQTAEFLQTVPVSGPQKMFYLDWTWRRMFLFFLKYRPEFSLQHPGDVKDISQIHNAWVVFDQDIDWSQFNWVNIEPNYQSLLNNIPRNWRLIKTFGSSKIYFAT